MGVGGLLENETKMALNKLNVNNVVKLYWIPGHRGHRGNEIADHLAKRGAKTVKHGCEPFLPVSNSFYKDEIKKWGSQKHNKAWRERVDCKQSKLFFHELRPRESNWLLSKNRTALNLMTGYITGHNRLNSHQLKLGNVADPTCRLCLEEYETSGHLILQCEAIARERNIALGAPFLKEGCKIAVKNFLNL